MLHPQVVKSVPIVPTSAAFAGAILISPWIILTTDAPSYAENKDVDAVSRDALERWGAAVLRQAPDEYSPFVEPGKAQEEWFNGIETIFERLFITAGDKECMRDDINGFARNLKKRFGTRSEGFTPSIKDEVSQQDHPKVTFLLEKGGVHDHSLVDFEVGETRLVETTRILVDWLADGFPGDRTRHKHF